LRSRPAPRSCRCVNIHELIKSGAGTGANRRQRRQYGSLVVLQVGIALVLMVGAALLIRTATIVFRIRVSPEYEKIVWAFPRILPQSRADSLERRTAVSARLVARAMTVPGVAAAGTLRYGAPKDRAITIFRGGAPVQVPTPLWSYAFASPTIVRALGGTITKGRDFSDQEFAEPLAIVDEATAVFLWPGEDPLGRQIRLGASHTDAPLVRVVGVARTPREWYGLRTTHEVERLRPRLGAVFVLESVDTSRVLQATGMQLVVRGSEDVHRLPLQLRRGFAELAPGISLVNASTFEERVGLRSQRERHGFMASLFTLFAAMAMLVAALGVYSIVSHSVSTRTREFGVRIALGATLREVRQSVFKEGNVLSLLGIALGLLATIRTAPMLRAFLMDETFVHDSWLHALVALCLFALTLAASWIPARRAMRINPVEALRND
jgi:putative ABC transport system permease protein